MIEEGPGGPSDKDAEYGNFTVNLGYNRWGLLYHSCDCLRSHHSSALLPPFGSKGEHRLRSYLSGWGTGFPGKLEHVMNEMGEE